MVEAKSLLKKLLVVPVVAVVHFTALLGVFLIAYLLTASTVPWWHAIGNVFKFITVNILLFPMNMNDKWFPLIGVGDYYLPINSLLWGFAAYVVILICHVIKKTTR